MNQFVTVPRNLSQLITLARKYYCPELVSIDEAVVANNPLPRAEVSPLRAGLAGRPAFDGQPQLAIAFLIAFNATNHMFWELVGGEFKRYEFDGKVGAEGWRAAFEKACGGEAPSLQALDNATCSVESMREHFGDLPEMETRFQIYREMLNGDRLMSVAGEILSRINTYGKLTVEDAAFLADVFPRAFNDIFLKKAQLALAFIAGHFAEAHGKKVEVEGTAFADYQVPRVMRAMGVLKYSEAVAHFVDNKKEIWAGSSIELALRAATILGCEQLASSCDATAAEVDNFIWMNRKKVGDVPFHLTVTSAY